MLDKHDKFSLEEKSSLLEEDLFFLAELQGIGYNDVMEMPWSRRKRLVDKKYEKEKSNANKGNKTRGRRSR